MTAEAGSEVGLAAPDGAYGNWAESQKKSWRYDDLEAFRAGYALARADLARVTAELESVCIDRDEVVLESARVTAERDAMVGLFERLMRWDHFDGAADGPFWRREIQTHLKAQQEPS